MPNLNTNTTLLSQPGNDLSPEIKTFYRTELLEEGKATVKVLNSTDQWYGVTYREDKPVVVAGIAQKTAEGLYPENLWG